MGEVISLSHRVGEGADAGGDKDKANKEAEKANKVIKEEFESQQHDLVKSIMKFVINELYNKKVMSSDETQKVITDLGLVADRENKTWIFKSSPNFGFNCLKVIHEITQKITTSVNNEFERTELQQKFDHSITPPLLSADQFLGKNKKPVEDDDYEMSM